MRSLVQFHLKRRILGLWSWRSLAPEDEDKYSFVRTSSAPADLMDRPGMVIREWENMDFYERIQADPTYIDRI